LKEPTEKFLQPLSLEELVITFFTHILAKQIIFKFFREVFKNDEPILLNQENVCV
jgi:hypothetical protein